MQSMFSQHEGGPELHRNELADLLLIAPPGLLEGWILHRLIVLAEDGGWWRLGVLDLHRLQATGVCGSCQLRPVLTSRPASLWQRCIPICSRMDPQLRRLNSDRRQYHAARPVDTPLGHLHNALK